VRRIDAAVADVGGEARLQAADYRVAVAVASTCPPGMVGRVDRTGAPGQGGAAPIDTSGRGR
jgi:hypothetical protein